ncbi:putative glycosylphosphatidylinositol (GPI) anchor [Trypanosoma conorhini]|uniref:Putative glycosylphosphatidylinositol (GPI) anchor n=1 Tax=Trypanosoma conorhini TaxID=83891 RepID=A0A422NTK4_9TRYP|nr:putative glycosylphosphatidylinositol (GPI) anchor [Trypanosoma conorhini]RNF08832.1 putative glycosylphosphatidylinositol (GPI) anchor [Trypanosoma conorhini]
MPFRFLVVFCVLLGLLLGPAVGEARAPTVPRTEKKYLIHIQPLTEGLDDVGEQPTLVSVTETTALWLPRGSAEDNDEHLTFNEDLDPFWVYVLRRRRFESLEWSGCGGSWRPDWSVTLVDANSSVSESTRKLIYDLSQHAVCYFSGLSACGWTEQEARGDNDGNASLSHDILAQRHHQWLAQFVSSLLSSPLSWSKETPRHVRPVGVLHSVPGGSGAAAGLGSRHWCSYHLAQHDTMCTQHVATILSGGRSGKGREEHIPEGIFRAGLVTVQDFFSSCFHHFHFGVSQSATPVENTAEETEIQLLVRMAFVARKRDFDALARHWRESLPSYAERLTFFVGPHVSATLRGAVESVSASLHATDAPGGGEAFARERRSTASEPTPTAHYYISKVGHDRGTYRLVIHPPITTTTTTANAGGGQASERWHGLNVGDTLDSLLIFPLHVFRPSLHEMYSGPDALSRLENAFFDGDANVLFVLVKTVLTKAHLRHQNGGANNTTPHGLVVCEFPFRFGWAALKDMPHDANSNRLLPQPVIRVGRRVEAAGPEGLTDTASTRSYNANWTGRCTASRCASFASMRIDHQTSLERLMDSLSRNPSRSESGSSCFCYYWLRCSNVAGTTIPVPDPAMVFNVISLGLIFTGVLSAGVTRITRLLFDREAEEDTASSKQDF